MPTLTIADTLKFANLQMAAEALFKFSAQVNPNQKPGTIGDPDTLYRNGPVEFATAEGKATNLTTGNERASRFASSQVAFSGLDKDWGVVQHISNTKTGFSGTLFRHTATNELVLSFRSTEFADDAARDTLQADSHEMANIGLALGQIDDMEAWYAHLKKSGQLPEGARYSVTGYSLGGHLASAFNLLRHEDNSFGQIDKVVTFNGAGIGRFSEPLTKIMVDFRDLRDAASTTDGLVDRLSSTAGKKLYRELHSYALTHGGALPLNASIRINELSKVVAPNEANELLKDENLLRTALTQVRAVVNLATTVSAVPSGSEGADNPANIPTTSIAGASFDYQLATLLIEKRHVIDNRGKIGVGWDIVTQGGIDKLPFLANGGALGNQTDVVGWELSSPKPVAVAAHTLYHTGSDARIFIEDQPQTRGDYLAALAGAAKSKPLVNGFSHNDYGDDHSLVLILDSLNVQNTLLKLMSASQQQNPQPLLNSILKHASYLVAEGNSGQGKAEGDVLENIVNALAGMVLSPKVIEEKKLRLKGDPNGNTWHRIESETKPDGTTGRDALYASLTAIVGSAAYQELLKAAKNSLVSLVSPTTDGSKARTDYAQFLALYHLAPFALQTSDDNALAALKAVDKKLSEQWDEDLKLDPDQRDAGKATFSDTWLTDRAEFLKRKQWFGDNNQEPEVIKRVLAGKNPPPLHGYQTEATYYEDLASGYRIAQEFDPDDEESAKRKTVKHYRFGGTGDDAITGGDLDDHLYGGDGHDQLRGKDGDDRLEGGAGNDVLDGGKGADKLYGGKGWDSYVLRDGDGKDTLVDINGETGDKIKEGRLLVGSTDPSKAMRGLGVLLEKDDSTWVSPDGKTTLRKEQGEDGDRWTLSLPEGGSVDLGAEFKEGDFGLRRLKLAEGNPDKLLEGDLLPKDFDTRTPDVLDVVHDPDGNVVISDAKTKAPNREDHLIGTLGVDSIQGKGGNDVLEGDRAAERDGGDDSTAQNDGGDDRLEGGEGSDIVAGQGGSDLLWGGSAPAGATMASASITAITAALKSGDRDESETTRGDWVDGGKGNDILIGGAAKDLLTGGVGSDLLIGGAGDDLLHGDRTIKVGSSREWEVTVDPKVPFDPKSPDQTQTKYTWTIKNGDTVGNDTEGGDDSLYGGKGDDWLLGGAGNDLLEGGDDDDVLFGEAGHDTLLGGAGSDVLHGDSPDITEDKFGNWLDGGSEDDEIFGGKGADVLIGGTGDDFLRGGEGRDTYIYNKGDGKDRVYDKDADKDSSVFVFGEGISAKDIILRKGSLLLDFGDGDELHIEEFNADDPLTNPSVASFEFADGGSFTWEELLARGFDLDGIEGDDLLTGTALQDRVDGKAGNDALQSGAGNDRLTGGAGTDALDGGLGDDTYVFHAGDGASRSIQINGETAVQVEMVVDEGGVDTLAFDASVDTRTLQLIDNDEGNLLIRYGSQAQAEQGQEGSDLLLVGQGLAGNIEHVQVGAGGTATQLSMTRFIGQYGEGVYRGTDATGHTHLTGGRSADFIVGSNGEEVSGGRGNDSIVLAGTGSTVHYAVGDGTDRVSTNRGDGNGNANVLRLAGVSADVLRLGLSPLGELALHVGTAATDVLLFTRFNAQDALAAPPFARIEFDDGSTLSYAELLAKGFDIAGTEGDDTLTGTNLVDRVAGGGGDDWLSGEAGDDTYVFNPGDGQDVIQDSQGLNTVQFGAGLAVADMSVSQSMAEDGDRYLDLRFTSGERLSILDGETGLVQSFRFADGTVLDLDQVLDMAPALNRRGGSGDDALAGGAGDDVLDGGAGADVLSGGDGADALTGGLGDDALHGGAGDDVLDGGAGNDMLVGGSGVDTYRFGAGMGQDTVIETGDETGNATSVLELLPGTTAALLTARQDGKDLVLSTRVAAASLRITDYYATAEHGASATAPWTVRTADGAATDMESFLGSLGDLGGQASTGSEFIAQYREQLSAGWSAAHVAQGYAIGADGVARRHSAYSEANGASTRFTALAQSARLSVTEVVTGDGEDTVGTYYGFYDAYRYESTFYAPNTPETESRSSVSERLSVVRQAEFTARTGLTGGNPTEASTLPNRRFIPAQGGALAADQTVGGYGQEGALIPVYYPSGQLKGHWYYPNASSAPTPQAGEAVVSVRREFIESDTSYVSSISRLGGGDDAVVGLNLDGGTGNDRLAINADRRYAQGDMALPVFLYGNDGNDHLFVAGESADSDIDGEAIMIGGRGRDRLSGSGGRNVFLLLEEDSIDTISDSGSTGTDELVFGPGVTAESIRVLRDDIDASSSMLQLLSPDGTGARIQIATGEHDAGKGIEVVSFSDGTQLTVAQLLARLDDSQEVLGSTWNDRLVLGAGDDVIDGGQGNDLLVGGRGNDVVRFGRGGGQDVIDQTGAGASDVDVLRFADDVQVADVTVFRDEHDLYFEIADSGDLVVVKHWFDGGTTRLASVEFAGGVVVDASAFDTAPFRGGVEGSDGNDVLRAPLTGNGTWAHLEGAAGDDVLHAGWGAKTLSGGAGDDVYVFGRGDGAGSVFRNGPEPGEDDGGDSSRLRDVTVGVDQGTAATSDRDVVRLRAGVAPGDVRIDADGNDLVVVITDTDDRLVLQDWLVSPETRVRSIGFADGTVWDEVALATMVGVDLDARQIINGTDGDDVLVGSEWTNEMNGGGGNDTLIGKRGDDVMVGGAGKDVYVVGPNESFDRIDALDGSPSTYPTEPDTIRFGEGISPSDVTVAPGADGTLTFTIHGGTSAINLRAWPENLPMVEFADGTVWFPHDLLPALFNTHSGDDAQSIMVGSYGDEVLRATRPGHSDIHGLDGQDTLMAGDGGALLVGGGGNDVLIGGAGRDRYFVDSASGFDTIAAGSGELSADVLEFGPEVRPEQLQFSRYVGASGNDLVLTIEGGNGSVTISDWFDPVSPSVLGEFYFWSMGASLSDEQVFALIWANNTAPVVIDGTMTTDAQIGSEFVWYLTDMLGDAEGDRLSYSVSLANGDPLPAWLTLDPVTGQLVGTPTETDMGSMELIGTASDGSGLASSVSMTISVIGAIPDSQGDDTYVFNPGDGVTHITDTGGYDTLVFGEGITPDAVTLGLGSLLIRTGLDGNEVHIEDFDPEAPLESAAIEQFVFADGTVLSLAELLARGFDIAGEGELNGTALRDRITGGTGDDVFNGGRGDDQLLGGAGDDTYHYRLGDGVDQIVDSQGVDRIVFGDGISAADVLVSRANGLITLTLSATDSLSFAENTAGDYAIERFEFADGSQWHAADVLSALARSRPEVGQSIDGSAAEEDAPWHFTLSEESFVDADVAAGDVLSLTAGLANGAPLPDWLRFDAASRRFSGVPTNDDVGLLSIRVTATDRAGNEVSQVFSLTVSNVNDAPTGTVSIEGAATENQTLSAASLLADLDGMGPVSYQWQSSSDGATWRDVAGATDATLVLGATQVGKQMRVVASYTDERGTGESVVSNITDTVARFNHAPVAASPIGDTSARRGALFTFAIPGGAFVDADAGDHLSYSATLANGEALPAWLQFAAETGTFSGTPGTSDIGVVVVQVTATDLAGAHSSQTFTLAVEAGNPDHAPIAEPDAAIVIEDSKRRAQGNVLTNDRDPEGKRLRVADPSNQHGEYGTLTLRANGTYVYVLDDASTKVQGLGAGETATDSFEYTVSDGKQRSGGKLVVTVKGTNDTPDLVHRLADVQLAKGKEFAWHVPEGSFQDADVRDTLSYSATLANGKALPAWLKFDAATQTFSGTAPAGAKGSINVRVTASDGHGARTTASDDFKISFGNQTIVPAALSGNEGAGNGADAPPPVANANASFDESSGMSPGQPGRNAGVAASQRTSQATVEPQSQRAESSASGDANLDQWLAAATVPWSANDSPSGTGASLSSDDAAAKPPGSGSGAIAGRNAGPIASRTLAQWQQMDAALAKHLGAAEDDSLGSDPAATANAAPQLATAIDPFAALAGASNSLRTLKGLNEGLRKGG